MRTLATPSHPGTRARKACAYVWLLALTLLLGTSQRALAQDARVLQDYQRLEQVLVEAKEAHAAHPTSYSLDILNQAVDTFKRFEQANGRAIEQAQRLNAPLNAQGTGGPDGFGYTYTDSNEPGGPTYSFIDISSTGALVSSGDDVCSGAVPLGGPGFNFYGVNYSSIFACTNGFLTDDLTAAGDLSNDCPLPAVPSTGAGARMYVLHDDLEADPNFGGNVLWEYFPSCPHPHSGAGCNVFQWNNVEHFDANGADQWDMEAILFDDGDFIYQYAPGNPEQGSGSTTGIQNGAASIGLTYELCNTGGIITDNLAVLWTAPNLTEADLAVTKDVDDPNPEVGDHVTFTIEVTHVTGGATFVRVEDKLPAGVSYVSHVASQGTYDDATGDWNVGVLAISSTAQLDITVAVNDAGTIINTAFIAFAVLPDPDLSNNSASAMLNAVEADLVVRKAVTGLRTEGGISTIDFLVSVTNNGPNDVCDVEVTDNLSSDMTLVAAAASQGIVVATPPTLTWDVGCLTNGASSTMSVTVTVTEGGSTLNTAEVTGTDLPDPNVSNNFSAAAGLSRDLPDFVPAGGPGGIINRGNRFTADVYVEKTVDVEMAAAGNQVTYTLTAGNDGPQSTASVAITDILPVCLSFVSATTDRGTYDETTGVWSVGKLKLNERFTLEIVAEVGADCTGTVENTAWVSGSTLPDPEDPAAGPFEPQATIENNTASASFDVSTAQARAGAVLSVNYPNPFNPTTTIPFSVSESSEVRLAIYDLLGRQVAVLVEGVVTAGSHAVVFEAGQLPTGVYLVRLEAAGKVQTQRITLMK